MPALPIQQPALVSPGRRRTLGAALACLMLPLTSMARVPEASAPVLSASVVAQFPHDSEAFTQGLAFDAGELFEGTGLHGRSSLRRVELQTGRVLRQVALPRQLFGEGIVVWGDQIIQLTWRAGRIRRYARDSFALIGELPLDGEGWGITHDGRHWIVSDGSDRLRFLEPGTGNPLREVRVRDAGVPVRRLNELEYVQGEVWANLWHADRIARIDPINGQVRAYLDLSGLWPRRQRSHKEAVLNGIAYDSERGRLFVTGKLWPHLYQIEPRD